jgi:hypothetical protein
MKNMTRKKFKKELREKKKAKKKALIWETFQTLLPVAIETLIKAIFK